MKIFTTLALWIWSMGLLAEPCSGGNSCWRITNNSTATIDINCTGYGEPEFFSAQSLAPNREFSQQYDEE